MAGPPMYFIRPYPSISWDTDSYIMKEDDGIMYVKPSHGKHPKDLFLRFDPHGILRDKSQKEVFDTVVKSSLTSCFLNKHDMIILSVGPKSSGKTYSMMELQEPDSHRGIVPRVLSALFERKKTVNKEGVIFKIEISCVGNRNSNNAFHDLLAERQKRVTHPRYVKKLMILRRQEGLDLLNRAFPQSQKKIESNNIITFHIKEICVPLNKVNNYKIHCIDTVSLNQIENRGLICNISSLVACFDIRMKLETREPFIMHYLGKETSNIQLITLAHFHAQATTLNDTLRTLRLASQSEGIKVHLESLQDDAIVVRRLRDTFKSLQAEAITRDSLNDERLVPYPRTKTQDEIDEIQAAAFKYFHKEITSLEQYTDIESMYIILDYFRFLCLYYEGNKSRFMLEKKVQVQIHCQYGCTVLESDHGKRKKKKNKEIKEKKETKSKRENKENKESKDKKKDKNKKKEEEETEESRRRRLMQEKTAKREARHAKLKEEKAAKEKLEQEELDKLFERFLMTENAKEKFAAFDEVQNDVIVVKNKLQTLADKYYKAQIYSEKKLLDCIDALSDEEKTLMDRQNMPKAANVEIDNESVDLDNDEFVNLDLQSNESDFYQDLQKLEDEILVSMKSSEELDFNAKAQNFPRKKYIQSVMKNFYRLDEYQRVLQESIVKLKDEVLAKNELMHHLKDKLERDFHEWQKSKLIQL